MKPVKDRIWNEYGQIDAEETSPGVVRKILAYTDEVMIVENHFEVGAVGALHHHPHTQITYIISGAFEFEINGEKRIVRAGDSLLKKNGIEHGCVCLEKGVLLDVFAPMREDFVKES
ncbi:MAG: cupin domain-containing protein [Lachnospiraceae bacterium]|nr:cupin domain-containing protein [Lachnospiraceae bacterium]